MTDRGARLGRCVIATVVAAGSLAIAAGPAAARSGADPAATGEDGRALGLVAKQFVVGPDAPLALTVSHIESSLANDFHESAICALG
jgi:hypothetical protein